VRIAVRYDAVHATCVILLPVVDDERPCSGVGKVTMGPEFTGEDLLLASGCAATHGSEGIDNAVEVVALSFWGLDVCRGRDVVPVRGEQGCGSIGL
jgi:hypothetical protein